MPKKFSTWYSQRITQRGRPFRRDRRRWCVERLFAWLHWFRPTPPPTPTWEHRKSLRTAYPKAMGLTSLGLPSHATRRSLDQQAEPPIEARLQLLPDRAIQARKGARRTERGIRC